MSTQVAQVPGGWVVSTIIRDGRRRKIPRGSVYVVDTSMEAMKVEVRRQALIARAELHVPPPPMEPVD